MLDNTNMRGGDGRRKYSHILQQQPPWGEKKVPVVKRWPFVEVPL